MEIMKKCKIFWGKTHKMSNTLNSVEDSTTWRLVVRRITGRAGNIRKAWCVFFVLAKLTFPQWSTFAVHFSEYRTTSKW